MNDDQPFGFERDPDRPNWFVRRARPVERFLDSVGELRVEIVDERHTRLHLVAHSQHRNLIESVHGGFIMAIVDQALFLGPGLAGIPGMVGASTIDASVQFIAPVQIDKPIAATTEVLRETRRMLFLRGVVEQDGTVCAAYSGTAKKVSQTR